MEGRAIKNHPVYLTSPFAKALLVYFSAYANRSGWMERRSIVNAYARCIHAINTSPVHVQGITRTYRVIGESGLAHSRNRDAHVRD